MELEQLVDESPSIKALGSLFKLTEIHLWDYSTTGNGGLSEYSKENLSQKYMKDSDAGSITTSMSRDDLDLSAQMDALGLPLSFCTNREKHGMIRGKRKDNNKNHLHTEAEIKDAVLNSIKVSEHEIKSSTIIHDNMDNSLCTMPMASQNESSYCDVAVDVNDVQFLSRAREDLVAVTERVVCAAETKNSGSGKTYELPLSCCLSRGTVNNQDLSNDDSVMESRSIDDKGSSHRNFLINQGNVHSEDIHKAGFIEPSCLVGTSVGGCCTDWEKPMCNICTKLSEDPKSHDVVSSLFSVALDHETTDGKCFIEDNQSKECEKLLDEICDWISQCPDSAACSQTELLTCDSVDAVSPSVKNHCTENGNVTYEESQCHDSTVFCQFPELNSDTVDIKCIYDFGDWKTYWDSYYCRCYFFNIRTQECTWDPPAGMEHLIYLDMNTESKVIGVDVDQKDVAVAVSSQNSQTLDSVDSQYNLNSMKHDTSQRQSLNETVEGHELTADNFDNSLITSTVRSIAEPLNESHEVKQSSVQSSIADQMEVLTTTLTESLQSTDPCFHYTSCRKDKVDTQCSTVDNKRKKKARRERMRRSISADKEDLLYQEFGEELSPIINKYWWQRYQLFSKFDCGILMDEEGWFSVTPELIAKHHASRCGSGTIVDCFTGVGGNAIQFALRCNHVIAIDIDPKKIDYAQHNAAIYGVDERVDFIRGDSFLLASNLKADTVFLSPPWGGPAYSKVKAFDIKTMLKPYDGFFLFNVAKKISPRIVMFLPRNVNLNQLAELSLSISPPWSLEVEQNFLNGRLKAITAYFCDPSVHDTSSP